MLRDRYKFFLRAVPTPTEATKNLGAVVDKD